MSWVAIAGIVLALQGQLNLALDPSQWGANVDSAGATAQIVQSPDAKLVVSITSDGTKEHYPKIVQNWATPQDWTKYMRLKTRVRLVSDDPEVRTKRITFVIYDQNTRREDLADRPMTQQCIGHEATVGKWVEFNDWLLNISRSAVPMIAVYLYDETPQSPHTYRWEFAQFELEGVGDKAQPFDTEVYSLGDLKVRKGTPAGKVSTSDSLELAFGSAGEVSSVSLDGKRAGAATTQPTGLLVRDVAAGGPPVMIGGEVRQKGADVVQTARSKAIGLGVDATIRSRGQYLEIAGTVSDLSGKDRAVTVYFAIPCADAPWQWWDSMAASRTKPDGGGEFANLEIGQAYGLNGAHSKYPIGAITRGAGTALRGAGVSPATLAGETPASRGTGPRGMAAGLTLGVRMDEPVVHRIAYNPSLHVFFVAADFGLVPDKRINGTSLSQAPFRFLLYRHDPAWGFRSALQRYYNFFPEFFTNRIPSKKQGGWFVWGDMSKMEGALDAGFAFHWGPGGADAVKWDNAKGVTSLLYIEPEYLQLTMGDFAKAPTPEQCVERLEKLAAGDEAEMAKTEKLAYAGGYAPGLWVKEHSLRGLLQTVAKAAVTSAYYDSTGHYYSMIGQFPWMGESKWGDIFPCNLDPKIPGGKGRFNSDVYLASGIREMEAAGAHYDGIGLDSLGGYGQERVNYRREHFRYADIPLSFSAIEHVPAEVAHFATIEWMRELSKDMHGRGKVLMANCSWGMTPAWLTFAGVHLDVFGAEAPQFTDPDYIRAIAYQKPCTDLPYDPRPDWEVNWHLLHGIYPGHGNKVEVMRKYAGLLRDMAAKGWEPITNARVTPDTVRIERFGPSGVVYLSVFNPSPQPVEAKISLDEKALGLWSHRATLLPGDSLKVVDNNGEIALSLGAKETVVLRMESRHE